MSFQRTQIYLDPGDHRQLSEEARRRGLSLTGLLREIVASHVRGRVAPYAGGGFEALIGVLDGDDDGGTADADVVRDAHLDARYVKKMGLAVRRPAKVVRRGARR